MRGFTLIEIMVVVVIVGLLATFGGYHVIRSFEEGRREVARAKCKECYDKAHLWQFHRKRLPASLEEMEAPLGPGEPPFARVEVDPWGNPYLLERGGADIRVRSFGPDGQEGTGDDLAYPEPQALRQTGQ